MMSSTLHVRIDDRIRLMSAALSVTNWPELEQARYRHRAHAHARGTTRWLMPQADHSAIRTLQTLLEQGTPLEALYTYVLTLPWPDLSARTSPAWVPLHWNEQLADFHQQAQLAEWWHEEQEGWNKAVGELEKIIADVDLCQFFEPFVGAIAEQWVLMPNISYPSDREIGLRLEGELVCITPPRIAWGDNEPWPFDEDAAHVFRGALSEYGRLLMVSYLRHNASEVAPVASKPLPVGEKLRSMYPTWGDQFTKLFVSGIVALFLEEKFGAQEAKAYILVENRVNGVTILPGVVSVLRHYVEDYREGRYERFVDFLPNFPKHLRVAKTLVSL